MTSPTPDLLSITQRLEKLERQNRWLKVAGSIFVLVVASLVFTAQAPSKKRVEANEFILRDAEGRVSAELLSTGAGASLGMYDPRGQLRAVLAVGKYGPGLVLVDANGKIRATFGLDDEEGPSLLQLDANGTRRLEIANQLRLFDANAKARVVLGTTAEAAQIGFNYIDQTPPMVLGAGNSGPALMMFNTEGKTVWLAP